MPDKRIITYKDAIKEALEIAMHDNPNMIMFGEGINDKEGMFGTTSGLCDKFGFDRVFDVPLSETGMTGIAVGTALAGIHTIYCHNRPDFLFLAMDQIINHAAKYRYMSGGQCDVPLIIWAPTGQGWGSAAQHSQELHGLFMQIPGLKIISPSTPYDVKGMLLAAVHDNNPVLFLDHRKLYTYTGHVPPDRYEVPLGSAHLRNVGNDLTIVAVSSMVPEAEKACEELLNNRRISVDLIDIRSIKPLDTETIVQSARKTGRVLVIDNSNLFGGLSAEIAAEVSMRAFGMLKSPVKRLAYPDVPVPASYALENAYYINKDKIITATVEMMGNE